MDILVYTLKSIAFAITEPYMAFLLVLMTFVLYRKNAKTAMIQKMVVGKTIDNAFELTISQVVIGIFAGTAASIIMSYLGIIFDEASTIDFVFLASVMFLFYKPRFISIAYSAATLGLLSILLGYASILSNNAVRDVFRIDIPAVMTMAAVLHLVEGVVILIDGKRGSLPVFSKRGDKIVGGFLMQRYWAVPVAAFFMLHDKSLVNSQLAVPLPLWWPILKTSIPLDVLRNAALMIIPFYGVIGFDTLTFTKNRERKVLESGVMKIVYSIILFGLAQLAYINILFKILVIVFAVGALEASLIIERKHELKDDPKYVSSEEGMMILEVAPSSPASEMGIKSGDLIVQINDKKVETEQMVTDILRESTNFIWINLKREDGKYEQLTYKKFIPEKRLGLVLVPRGMPGENMMIKFEGNSINGVLNKLKKKDNDR